MFDPDLFGEIKKMIFQETKYLRHWIGKVVDNADPGQTPAGRIKVQIDELGFDSPATALWCWPRQSHGMDVPAAGEWVEVWFISGHPNRPVYLAGVQEIAGFVPAAYKDPTSHVLYQNPKTGDSMTYDEAKSELDLLMATLKIGDGSEAFVKGSTFYTFMTSLMTWLGTHVHSGVTTGPGLSGTAAGAPSMTDFRSTKVLGQ